MTGYLRRNRNCLPEIAPQGHFLALRAQGATSGFRPPRNDKLGGHCLFNIGPHFPPVQCRARLSPPLQCTAESLVQLSTFHSRLSTSIPLFLYT